ncbi:MULTISPECIES: hypothetical protein [unclassified Micromonospora]|uniref:hypothetical protein n=1 Tax=unclassified Micromonospora TaxID=2617518 RepID=UPI0003EEB32E|nr:MULTISPECIES: hypothetical protein [unclassified Micromonospora]EWM66942.1 hypothetical protein MCBG_04075 [Micromonospora sp. M42]MCK1804888.1 hypothetical protein [Micromonospora sp. R42106]MCK1831093.1 hypothetical protein [Micromonospora sp. R42003]MCK1842197.1 hypothetical protein [Micromonospora sp. R42004]MCM1020196.1 hypothetical protein [Micromonospora sp. XM-20-01]
MARQRIATGATALLAAAALGLAGCGASRPGAEPDRAVEVSAAMGAEGQALAALGLDAGDLDVEPVAAPASTGTPQAGPDGKGERAEGNKRHRARVLLRRNTLHGEAVVRTRDGGTRTVAVQRGEVTAIDERSMTVKSTDGFTATWTFGDKLRVVERRTAIRSNDIKIGTTVAVAGAKDDGGNVARLVVVPIRQE